MEKNIRFSRHENRAIRTAGIIDKILQPGSPAIKIKAPVETGALVPLTKNDCNY